MSQKTPLQSLILPEVGLCTERDNYVHTTGAVTLSEHGLEFGVSGQADFGTYFNLFPAGQWRDACDLSQLNICLEGSGRFEVRLMQAGVGFEWHDSPVLVETLDITLTEGKPHLIDVSDALSTGQVLSLVLTCLETGSLSKLEWQTDAPPLRHPDLAICITTFKREDAVLRTAERFASHFANHPIQNRIAALVIDNGKTLDAQTIEREAPIIRVFPNANLGGAGGFARGMLEARASGASHCLLMDDDASVHMESIERCWTYLAYATNPNTAIAGAMLNAARPWRVWENGATFHRFCKPLQMDADLRYVGPTMHMSIEAAGRPPQNLYGGWWFFAFALDAAHHLPFPFFVRGDDVSFSLVHEAFDITRLPGIASFQDSFTDKESPLVWYLDTRSHIAHHLTLPNLKIGARRTVWIPVWFVLRNLIRQHYETIDGVLLALEDIIAGPETLLNAPDAAERRKQIAALTKVETWTPTTPDQFPEGAPQSGTHREGLRLMMKLTLNGHFLPFFGRLGRHITLPAHMRGAIRPHWGAAKITYFNEDRSKSYTVSHSKTKAASRLWKTLKLTFVFCLKYRHLLEAWQTAYTKATDKTYWLDALTIEAPEMNAPLFDGKTAPSKRNTDERAGPRGEHRDG